MNTRELLNQLGWEYYGIQANNPSWNKTLVEFLQERGVSDDDIWESYPEEAEEAELPVPEWL